MRILLLTESIFSETGGGQTFFQGMIRNHAHQYVCFGQPSPDAPPNVRMVPLTDINRSALYRFGAEVFNRFTETTELAGKESDFLRLMDMAASVAGGVFDIVEAPDYLPFAALLPDCLRYHNVRFGKFVLSMHGCLSSALEGNWQGDALQLECLKRFEDLCYRVADIRYGIGRSYVRGWQERTGLPAQLFDVRNALPVRDFSQGRDFVTSADPARQPDLCFIGRQEKWKGPELFVQLAALIPPTAFDRVRLIGPAVSILGFTSTDHLRTMAARRGLACVEETLPRSALLHEFSNARMLLVVPSWFDTFNLVAYEAAMSGCPMVLSTQCGICDFLDGAFPGFPYLKLDIGDLDGSIEPVTELLRSYDDRRQTIADYLARNPGRPWGAEIEEVYQADHTADAEAVHRVGALFNALIKAIDTIILPPVHATLRSALQSRLSDIAQFSEHRLQPARYVGMLDHAALVRSTRRDFDAGLEKSRLIEQLEPLVFSGNRASTYALLADIEQARGNQLVYATYKIREIRLSGRNQPAELAAVSRILRDEGLEKEAGAAALLYGGGTAQSAYDQLCATRDGLRDAPVEDFDAVEDLRHLENPRCSIVVSVDGAAGKISRFITNLSCLTPRSLQMVELVVVNNVSQDDTQAALIECLRHARSTYGLSILCVTTPRRETVQTAWNRGIGLARGDYLALLSVDEMNRPDAFDLLTDYLDRHPGVDWVQGNAITTEVNASGGYVRDVAAHRRQPASRLMHLLDYDMIDHVGALYRRSIHSRFGYYDGSLRAGGGTEFKNRILSRIQLGTIDESLGIVLKDSDKDNPQSPVAELEDLRAWYLHRSPGGLRYTFDDLAIEEAVDLFGRAMNYSKSSMETACTDVELAIGLGDYIRDRAPQTYPQISRYVPGLKTIQHDYQQLDEISRAGSSTSVLDAHTASGMIETGAYSIAQVGRSHRHIGGDVVYDFQNDNRSHQRQTVWPGTPNVGRL